MLNGVDLHPTFQAGISIPQVHNEGNSFIICKLSQGTQSKSYEGSFPWMATARSLGMVAMGYHYLTDGNPVGQAQVFAAQLARGGISGALDVEKGSGNINNVHAFLQECSRIGARISLLYLPQWYWKEIGSPSLTGLPPLWSSRYPDMVVGSPAQNYSRVPSSFWHGYGGNSVAVLQYTSSARVAGHTVDCNAFNGTLDDFKALTVPQFSPVPSPNSLNPSLTQTGFLMALTDAEQAEVLATVRNLNYQLVTGPDQTHMGWPAFDGGTPGNHTVVDYLRLNDVAMRAVVDEVKNAVQSALTPTSASATPAAPAAPGLDEAALTAIVEQAVMGVMNKVKLSAS